MPKHPKLNASSTSTPPEAHDHDDTEPAQNSPQDSRYQGEEATYPNAGRCNSEIVGRHLDQITARRRKLLERLTETYPLRQATAGAPL